ncbi:triosephosphate isomerase (TIM) [Nematocida ausubeli]|nr:triosephosphate isomerase (TIM) [Nematocida ausubeli]
MRICVGNWKMNGTKEMVQNISHKMNEREGDLANIEVVICVPYTLLYEARKSFSSAFAIGAQTMCAYAEKGAYTGGISIEQMKDAQVQSVIIGHSERVKYFHETEEEVKNQVEMAVKNSLSVILCVGEHAKNGSLEENSLIIKNRLNIVKNLGVPSARIYIAYEPVWAIGTGDMPSAERIQGIVQMIHEEMGDKIQGILYGGSVTKETVQPLLSISHLSGFLVGNASLTTEFAEICEIVSQAN